MTTSDGFSDVQVLTSAQAGLAALQHAARGDQVSALQTAVRAPDHFAVLNQILVTAGYVLSRSGDEGARFLANELHSFAQMSAWAEAHEPTEVETDE
ncbi:hypothetical protein [Nesterenkonia marinintestina]|uniref:hypothetical protein n=1 Tax=Nesterenkonia marinintestina TaxID=2979865 RepID=UPI0021C22704|nr:hypothetical protein [Nesterenkonia sp. GX14115]